MIWLVVAVLLLIYGLYEYTWFRVVKLHKNDFTQRTSSITGKRLIFLSDLQYDHWFSGFQHRAARKLVRMVNDLEPDLILFGGDFIHKDQEHAFDVFSYLDQMKAKKVAILGNHDDRNLERVLKECINRNITVLRDEVYDYHGVTIVGFDRTWDERSSVFDYSDRDFVIALSHSPDFLVRHTVEADIMLAGHLHGGQISLFGFYSPITNSAYRQKYLHGLKSIEASKVYVSPGLGGFVWFLPIRFFVRPEIIVIDF